MFVPGALRQLARARKAFHWKALATQLGGAISVQLKLKGFQDVSSLATEILTVIEVMRSGIVTNDHYEGEAGNR